MSNRLLICTNMPAPYRIPLFNRIAQDGIGLTVLFYRRIDGHRTWSVDLSRAIFAHQILTESRKIGLHGVGRMLLAIWRHRRDTVVVGGWGDLESLLVAVACSVLRVRWFLWLGLNRAPEKGGMRGGIKYRMLRHAHGVVCYHRGTATIVRPLVDPEKPLHVGWNVGDIGRIAAAVPAGNERARTTLPRVIYLGVLNERKGVDLLLQAVERGELPCALELVGDGPLMDRARAAAARAAPGRVKVHGFLEGADLHRLLASADALVLPTRNDPGAIVLSEALASGLCLLVSEADGGLEDFTSRLPAYVQTFPADDYAALVRALNAFAEEVWPRLPGKADIRREFLALDPMGIYARAFVACVGQPK